jgi:hypothetical protein
VLIRWQSCNLCSTSIHHPYPSELNLFSKVCGGILFSLMQHHILRFTES